MGMWNCDEVDETGSAVWGFGINSIQPSVAARLSEIYLHSVPDRSVITFRILVCCNNTKTQN
jgi:hypothetical protein